MSRSYKRVECAQIFTDAGCDLAVFTLRTKPDFQMARHHQLVCHYLEMLVSGEIRRLMILMPPRHGKSELVSRRLPAYFLGRFPDANIIACSYGADLAERMSRDCQRIIDGPAFRNIFPDVGLKKGVRTNRVRHSVCSSPTMPAL
jgi:hypothetical protein